MAGARDTAWYRTPRAVAVLSRGERLVVIGLVLVAVVAGSAALAPIMVTSPWAGIALGGLALGAATAATAVRRWRLAERRARRYRRRNRLLSQAALEMQQLHTRNEIYGALPRLLVTVLECEHAEVFVPRDDHLELVSIARLELAPGYRLPLASITGRALRQRRMVYVPDLREEGESVPAPGAPPSGSEVALPLRVQGRVVAVLNAEHRAVGGFTEGDRETLEAMASIAEDTLARLEALNDLNRQRHESTLFAGVVESLLRAEDAPAAARAALHGVSELLDVQARAVLELRGDRFVPLHLEGELPDTLRPYLEHGLPYQPGALVDAWRQRRALFVEDYQRFPHGLHTYRGTGVRSVAVIPIVDGSGASRAVLMLAEFRRVHAWSPSTRSMLQALANALGVALLRLRSQAQLLELLGVVRTLARSDDPEQLYRRAAEAVVRLIPGADAATILVRSEDGFRYAGGDGYDLDALTAAGPIGFAEEMRWYGLGEDAFMRGIPRLLTGEDVGARSAEAAAEPRKVKALTEAGRIFDIRANVSVPIPVEREVIGLLNVDSFTVADAFGPSDLELAEAFAQQVGVIIRQAQTREALAGSVISDPVTGLGNREGFNRRLALEMAKARRHRHEVHLVMMDLDGFKRINDLLGHHTGDLALQRVARALEAERRTEDGLFRWGGDEFVLVLSGIGGDEARQTAQRYADAVSRETIEGMALSVSVGIASFPGDGADADALLRRADDLMYSHKHEPGRVLMSVTSPPGHDDQPAGGGPVEPEEASSGSEEAPSGSEVS